MKRNKKICLLGIFISLLVLTITIMCGKIIDKKQYEQLKLESVLPKQKEAEDNTDIRVLIKTTGFAQIVHASVELQSEGGIIVISGGKQKEYDDQYSIKITPDHPWFQNGTIKLMSKSKGEKIKVLSLERGYGVPSYRGTIELFSTAEGIVIVNELSIEEYLCAVVPSEMPSSYNIEALKAQAVCARSYAYNQTRNYAYPEYQAHVDDSTSFQVYGNSQEKESTNRAVKETTGNKVWYNNQVATTYYYSTSCGKTTSIEAWGTKFNETNQYLQSREICDEQGVDYEVEMPWYRWQATIPSQVMSDLIEYNTQTEIGDLLNIAITRKGAGGVVQEITVVGTTEKIVISTENKIRKAMGGNGYSIVKQDGNVVNSTSLLPSAFFTIEKKEGNYIIKGGGYGHGIGMSQNGANEMAKNGKDYKEILKAFYAGVEVR